MSKHIEMIIDYIVKDEDFQYNDNHGILTRCKDCKYYKGWRPDARECSIHDGFLNPNGYCSKAVRIDGET